MDGVAGFARDPTVVRERASPDSRGAIAWLQDRLVQWCRHPRQLRVPALPHPSHSSFTWSSDQATIPVSAIHRKRVRQNGYGD